LIAAFLPDNVKLILLGVLVLGAGLVWALRLPRGAVDAAEQARRRRAGDRNAGLEIALLGLVLPFIYIAATVMMFNDFKPLPTVLVAASSAGCIALGVWLYARNREP